ncbi:glutathione S-transferase kappa 1 [Mytilinidion resinicola]|uniref:Glutathione S-transferase kappa n=1 Tax=Mytilinidion resinicola TaxID=574789 RepID=A0A6A6Z0B2_9PEZI|nr:glutathione S-transferase kappa 1 [Mytilinidion resinicola]KAF2814602.1 glutathione S-transferase kappa 1 [Mytilinidion resinicola]
MGGKIECYLDVVSPYSYYALLYLEKNREVLKSHDVDIEIIPVFLGGINVGSGNKPPWTLPAKAKYSTYDSERAKKYFGVPGIKTPSFFPILSLPPQRALTYIRAHHASLLIPAFLTLFSAMWIDGHDISKPDLLAQALSVHFSPNETKAILEGASQQQYKQELSAKTQEALDRGAFGCPWFWVTNAAGVGEPFFGSDRFHFMWEFLGLPWKAVELLPSGQAKAKI